MAEEINLNEIFDGKIGEDEYEFKKEKSLGSYSVYADGVLEGSPCKVLRDLNSLPSPIVLQWDNAKIPFFNDKVFPTKPLLHVLIDDVLPDISNKFHEYDIISSIGTLKTLMGLFLYDNRANNRRVRSFQIDVRCFNGRNESNDVSNFIVFRDYFGKAGKKAFDIPFEKEVSRSDLQIEFSNYRIHSFILNGMRFLVRSEIDCYNTDGEAVEVKYRANKLTRKGDIDFHRHLWSEMQLASVGTAVIGKATGKAVSDQETLCSTVHVQTSTVTRLEVAESGEITYEIAGTIIANFAALIRRIKDSLQPGQHIELHFDISNPDILLINYI
jgi:hypothetical protein